MDGLQRLCIVLCLTSFGGFLLTLVPLYYCAILMGWHFLDHLEFITRLFPIVPYFVFTTCLVSLVVSIYGCAVATSYNKIHLAIYSGLSLGMFGFHCAWIYLAVELRIFIESQSFSSVDIFGFVSRYVWDESARNAWDILQANHHCCGGFGEVNGYKVWKDVPMMNNSVPDSCCQTPMPGCGKNLFALFIKQAIYKITVRGCMGVLEQDMLSNVSPILQTCSLAGGMIALLHMICVAISASAAVEVDRTADYYPEEPYPLASPHLGHDYGDSKRERLGRPLTQTSSTITL
ncbi:tetraspanin-9-like [Tigriopus californicus]|uniref:tetraspanin-9-like n=1 Tax=Tigriopus californicus TaxID=6832 RepID=UPI0027DA7215|nr:tetraspanin-9-like [Tigriopus californicus]